MKPKPFVVLNHFTVPVAKVSSFDHRRVGPMGSNDTGTLTLVDGSGVNEKHASCRVYRTGPKFRILVAYLCCKHGRAGVIWLQDQDAVVKGLNALIAPMRLIPGQLILRKPTTWVVYLHFMRQVGAPVPKHQISISLFGAGRKAGYYDACRAPRLESIVYRPGWGSPSFGKRGGPTAGYFLHRNGIRGPTNFRSKIRNVITVDIVGTKYTGVDAMGKPLIGFLYRRHHTEGEIESWHAFWVEPRASYSRAIS